MSRFACPFVVGVIALWASTARAEPANVPEKNLPDAIPGVALLAAPNAPSPRQLLQYRLMTPESPTSESEVEARRVVGQFRDIWSQFQVDVRRDRLELSLKGSF